MKTKPADVKYCGCNVYSIRNAQPTIDSFNFIKFARYINERYFIHILKDVHKWDPPYTQDPILQSYRFTNVRREHDTQTKALIKLVSTNQTLSFEDKAVNTFLFRAWNNYETFKFFDLPKRADRLYHSGAKVHAQFKLHNYRYDNPEESNKRKWYSAAYIQGGCKASWRAPLLGDNTPEPDMPLRVFHIGPWLKEQNIVNRLLAAHDQQEAFEIIRSVRGFSDFLAYQVFVDLTYIDEFPFSENEFTVAGPGCKRGLDFIFKYYDNMTPEEAVFWLRDNFKRLCRQNNVPWKPEEVFIDLPSYDRHLNVMMLENCLCEISKYLKVYYDLGRPRQRYNGKGDSNE